MKLIEIDMGKIVAMIRKDNEAKQRVFAGSLTQHPGLPMDNIVEN